MGPLYHLTETSWRHCGRHTGAEAGGVVIAKAINRFASLLDGLTEGYIDDPDFVSILRRDLVDGQHRGLADDFGYFTTGYFHRPEELETEGGRRGSSRWARMRCRGQEPQPRIWTGACPTL